MKRSPSDKSDREKVRELTAPKPVEHHNVLREDPLKADFRNFLYVVWKHLNLPDPTPVQYDIAHWLQHGPKRAMLSAFRGVGKSYITSAFAVWQLYRNPQLNIMVVSASKDRADAFSIFTKRLIQDMPMLKHLRPRKGQRDSSVAFDVGPATNSHSPSVKSVGITGQLTGSRADIIIADDIESLNNSATQTMRDQLAERVKEFDAVLKPLETSRVIYLGTPQTNMSMYNQLPERGYEFRIWPAEIPAKPSSYNGRLAPFVTALIEAGAEVGDPICIRFTEMDLLERKASYGRSGYALQFMLDTTLSDADRYPLRLRDLIVHACDLDMGPAKLVWSNHPDQYVSHLPSIGQPGDRFYRPAWIAKEMAPYTAKLMAIDPSGRGEDDTSYVILYMVHGMIFVMDWGGYKDGYAEETLKDLALKAKFYKVNEIICETNFGDGMFEALLKPVVARVHPCKIEGVRSTGQKERRICDVLEPVMNQHRLVFNQPAIEKDAPVEDGQIVGDVKRTMMYQLTHMTRDRGALAKDDRADVLAIGVHHFVNAMARDTDKAAEEHREELIKDALEQFHNNVLNTGLPMGMDHGADLNWTDSF